MPYFGCNEFISSSRRYCRPSTSSRSALRSWRRPSFMELTEGWKMVDVFLEALLFNVIEMHTVLSSWSFLLRRFIVDLPGFKCPILMKTWTSTDCLSDNFSSQGCFLQTCHGPLPLGIIFHNICVPHATVPIILSDKTQKHPITLQKRLCSLAKKFEVRL